MACAASPASLVPYRRIAPVCALSLPLFVVGWSPALAPANYGLWPVAYRSLEAAKAAIACARPNDAPATPLVWWHSPKETYELASEPTGGGWSIDRISRVDDR